MPRQAHPRLARSPIDLAPIPIRAARSVPLRLRVAEDGTRQGRDASAPAPAAEIAFLAEHGFSREALSAASARAARLGVSAEDVLIREGFCSEELFYRCLASSLGLPFAEHFTVIRQPPLESLPRCSLAHVEAGDAIEFAVAPRGVQIANLFAVHGRRLAGTHRLAITSPSRLSRAVLAGSANEVSRRAALPPLGDAAGWCARPFPSWRQGVVLGAAALVACAGFHWAEDWAWLTLALALASSFLVQAVVRAVGLFHGLRADFISRPKPLREEALPFYTLLVPLYREPRVLSALVQALSELDYPATKLDIKLLVESCDEETRREALRLDLQHPFELVLCPAGQPRTKPRALNIGLMLARDGLLTVYDAEDRPERDQLRLAAARFAAAPGEVACLQASLAIDNAGETWLTRHFALEYAQLFDLMLPGLARLGLPLPLGGTSNHFRVSALRAAGGWDAWNVTEDADLGLRLARLGFEVRRLDSTTWEEAPTSVKAWMGQRTRWHKGWLQTTIVHLRRRRKALPLGALGLAALYAHTMGLVLGILAWPFFTAALAWHLVLPARVAAGSWPSAVIAVLEPTVAIAGVALFLYGWALGAAKRGLWLRPGDVFLLPFYMLLVSWAGWRAVLEFVHAPFRWAKTEHGIARMRVDRRGPP